MRRKDKVLVILEGPDNIGKTNLARTIAWEYDAEYIHDGAPKGTGKDAAKHAVEKIQQVEQRLRHWRDHEDGEMYVFDRSFLGEFVYGTRYRQYTVGEDYQQIAQRILTGLGLQTIVVVCYADDAVYRAWNISPKRDEAQAYQQASEAKHVSTAFINTVSEFRGTHTLMVNASNYTGFLQRNGYIQEWLDAVLRGETMKRTRTNDYTGLFYRPEQRFWTEHGFRGHAYLCDMFPALCELGQQHQQSNFGLSHAVPTHGYGSLYRAKWIFVGEAPGHKGCGALGMPFYNDVSGNLFQSMLDALQILPTDVYVTNTIKCCPTNNQLQKFGSLTNQLKLTCVQQLAAEIANVKKYSPNAKVVPVGRVAAKACQKLGIDFGVSIKHPAYFCRMGMPSAYAAYCRRTLFS